MGFGNVRVGGNGIGEGILLSENERRALHGMNSLILFLFLAEGISSTLSGRFENGQVQIMFLNLVIKMDPVLSGQFFRLAHVPLAFPGVHALRSRGPPGRDPREAAGKKMSSSRD